MARTIEYNGITWYTYHGALLPDAPPHKNIILSPNDASVLLKKSKTYFIKWTSNFDSDIKYPFWYVIKDEREDETLLNYNSKIRSEIRRGFKNCDTELVKTLDDELIISLYDIYKNAFRRYKKLYFEKVNFENFKNGITSAIKKDDRDLWIVREKKNKMPIAYAWIIRKGNVANYSSIKYHPDYLRLYPAYALTFEVNRYYLNELNYLYIHNGNRSLGHETNINEWLIKKFRFRKAYCRLHVFYNSGVRLLVDFLMPYYKFFEEINSRLDNRYLMKLLILLRHEVVVRESERLENIAKWK